MSTQTLDAGAPAPVSITYKVGNVTKTYNDVELLVVACDPRNLIPVCNYTPAERYVFDRLSNFTYHTTLLRVKRNNVRSDYGVIFSADAMDRMNGQVYVFRNETVKTFGFDAANSMSENLVTVYQINTSPWPAAKFEAYLKQQLQTIWWWPYGRTYGTDYEILTSVTTPYFDHFTLAQLTADNSLPWDLLNLQGQHRTLYVHASACFESILQCWQYANMLLDNSLVTLPQNRNAHIVILGAGASGILFANRLRDLNYTNVEILEVTDRSDGKIHTIKMNGPYPPGNNQPTYCELGACYLSPAYDDFVTYLKPFLTGNSRIPVASNAEADQFRGIVTTNQFPNNWPPVKPLMRFSDYVLEKARYELDAPGYSDLEIEGLLGFFLEGYKLLYPFYRGTNLPIPLTQPANFNQFGTQTLYDYLNQRGMSSLVGALQYGYSVQGYGALGQVSAFYGLIWIAPSVIQGMIDSGIFGTAVVTAWSKGWGDVFDQMKAGMKITCNATTTNITRPN